MRSPTPIAVALILGLAACGATDHSGNSSPLAAKTTGEGSSATTATSTGVVYDRDDAPIRYYGHAADAVDRSAITTVLKRYYAAAARHDGAQTCRLLASLTAEAIPEDYEEQPALRGRTCAAVMSALFSRRQRQLSLDNATLEVLEARTEGDTALALLRFASASEPNQIQLHRQGSSWRVWEVLAQQMP